MHFISANVEAKDSLYQTYGPLSSVDLNGYTSMGADVLDDQQ